MTDVAVVGLALGDEGKGATVDAVAAETGARDVVRFGGGPQALHHVVSPEGAWHGCSQLGSAVLHPGARTWLGPDMLVDPLSLGLELAAAAPLGVRAESLRLHAEAVVVTPIHRLVNRARERARGAARHGSCGRGVGEAWADAHERGVAPVRLGEVAALAQGRLGDGGRDVFDRLEATRLRGWASLGEFATGERSAAPEAAALADPGLVSHVLGLWRDRCGAWLGGGDFGSDVLGGDAYLAGLQRAGPLVYEGAQGAGLDREAGLWPHVTATDCSAAGARRLADRLGRAAVVVGVTRATTTRHGAGPLPSQAADLRGHISEAHNGVGPWQGAFRHGWLDLVWLRSGVALSRPDLLALTCLDHLSGLPQVALCEGWWVPAAPPPGTEDWTLGERAGPGEATLIRALLPPTTPRDRELRRAFTEVLGAARPALRWLPGWPRTRVAGGALHPHARAFAQAVSRALQVPLWSVADGPTRADRVPLRPLA